MANYNLVVGSKFTPYTYDELIKPVQATHDAHQTLSTQYADTYDKAGLLEGSINRELDQATAMQYEKYMNDLSNMADTLAKEGINSSNRRNFLEMKRRYNKEIIPVEQAINKRAELTKAQREALERDSSLMFDREYANISLDDMLHNNNATYTSLSGSELAKRSGTMAANLAKTIQNDPKYRHIMSGQYMEQMQQAGYTPEQIMSTIINSDSAPKELKNIVDSVWKEYNLDNWDDATRNRARNYINEGLYNAIGTRSYNTISDKSYETAGQKEDRDMKKKAFEAQQLKWEEEQKGVLLPDGTRVKPIGAGRSLIYKPDGSWRIDYGKDPNNTTSTSNITLSKALNSVAKVTDKPVIVANTRGVWRIGEEGEDVKGTLMGMTRSNMVTSWGNYTLDNVITKDNIIEISDLIKDSKGNRANTDISEDAAYALVEAIKEYDLDEKEYNIVRVKAEGERAAGDYDYVLLPKKLVDAYKNTSTDSESSSTTTTSTTTPTDSISKTNTNKPEPVQTKDNGKQPVDSLSIIFK